MIKMFHLMLLNHPQVIGRFRVLKTDVLKINIDDLSSENI